MQLTTTYGGVFTPDVAEEISMRFHAKDALIYNLLLARGRIVGTDAEEFQWGQGQRAERRSAINNGGAAYDETTTSIVVDDGTVFYPNCEVLCEATGEVILVTAVSSNTLTVVRGVGSVVAAAAASVADNASLRVIGSARGEGADGPTSREAAITMTSNYIQTFIEAISESGRMQRVKTLTENDRAFQRRVKLREQLTSIESAIMFGAKGYKTDAAGKRVTMTGGIYQAVQSNVTTGMGAVTDRELFDAMEPAFRSKGAEKLLLCGTTFASVLHELFGKNVRIEAGERLVGLRIGVFMTPWGDCRFMHHQLLDGDYAGDAVLLDTEDLWWKVSEQNGGGRLRIIEGTQTPGRDAVEDQFFAEGGFQWGDERDHAILRGVTGVI